MLLIDLSSLTKDNHTEFQRIRELAKSDRLKLKITLDKSLYPRYWTNHLVPDGVTVK